MGNLNPNQFNIEISQESQREMQAAAQAGKMYAEVKSSGQRTPVKLDDPTDLQAHLISAHEWEDYDFHRNSNWHGKDLDPVLGRNQQDDDYRMEHHEVRRCTSTSTEAHRQDWPNAVTMGHEHFHE